MSETTEAELDAVVHGAMAPGFLGLLLARIVDRLVEGGTEPAAAFGIRTPVRAFSLIMLLAHAHQSVTELAARLGVTHAAVIKTAKLLEDMDLLGRGEDPADARRKPLRLTVAGRAEAERVARYMQRTNQVYASIFAEIGVDLFAAAQAFDAALVREGFAARFDRAEP